MPVEVPEDVTLTWPAKRELDSSGENGAGSSRPHESQPRPAGGPEEEEADERPGAHPDASGQRPERPLREEVLITARQFLRAEAHTVSSRFARLFVERLRDARKVGTLGGALPLGWPKKAGEDVSSAPDLATARRHEGAPRAAPDRAPFHPGGGRGGAMGVPGEAGDAGAAPEGAGVPVSSTGVEGEGGRARRRRVSSRAGGGRPGAPSRPPPARPELRASFVHLPGSPDQRTRSGRREGPATRRTGPAHPLRPVNYTPLHRRIPAHGTSRRFCLQEGDNSRFLSRRCGATQACPRRQEGTCADVRRD